MSRSKSSTQIKEPASLPDVPLPLSQVPEDQRAAYELEVIDDPEMFRKVLSSEDFFQMIASFPDAWWERLSMYLYRLEDDGGLMVKNASGQDKYILPILRHPVDRDWIGKKNGGGKYQLWLNLSHPSPGNPERRIQTTVRKYTFRLDGPPIVKDGQIVELGGKPVSVGAAATAAAATDNTDVAKVIDANALATERIMGMMENANAKTIDMIEKRATAAATVPTESTLDTAIKLMELMKPQQPQGNSMKDTLEIIDRLDAMAARRNPPQPQEQPETPIEQTLSAVEKLTGGVSLPELLKPHTRSAPPDSISPWVPMAEAAAKLVANLIDKYPVIQQQQNDRLRLEIHLRSMGQPGQPQLAPPPPPPPGPTIVQPQGPPRPPVNPPIAPAAAAPQPPDQGQLMNAVVQMVIAGFQRQPIGSWGKETATAIDFHFGELIDSMGIGSFLGDEAQVREFIAGHPELNQLSKSDARFFSMFLPDFLEYTVEERWGAPQSSEGEQENGHPPIEMPSVSRTALPTA